jgi:hypothetical protein
VLPQESQDSSIEEDEEDESLGLHIIDEFDMLGDEDGSNYYYFSVHYKDEADPEPACDSNTRSHTRANSPVIRDYMGTTPEAWVSVVFGKHQGHRSMLMMDS